MKDMTQQELDIVIENHEKWLSGKGGQKAILERFDLRQLDFHGANLQAAIFTGSNLSYCKMDNANFERAGFDFADMRYANITDSNLKATSCMCTNLYGADLTLVDLQFADLRNADLRNAGLVKSVLDESFLLGADLGGAHLYGASLYDVKFDETTAFFVMQCPEEGSYIGFKKCRWNTIVKLLIPEDALRSSATSRKCRASKAKVLSITNGDGSDCGRKSVPSNRDPDFVYTVGKTVEVPDFNTNRWIECASGIHHFLTRAEAVRYEL